MNLNLLPPPGTRARSHLDKLIHDEAHNIVGCLTMLKTIIEINPWPKTPIGQVIEQMVMDKIRSYGYFIQDESDDSSHGKIKISFSSFSPSNVISQQLKNSDDDQTNIGSEFNVQDISQHPESISSFSNPDELTDIEPPEKFEGDTRSSQSFTIKVGLDLEDLTKSISALTYRVEQCEGEIKFLKTFTEADRDGVY
jgi:hypothetical protein